MRALALVTQRELRAYAPAWVAALVAAVLPWLAPLLPLPGHQPAADVRLGTAVAMAGLLGLTFALFAGAGLLARDLGEGRMGFFLGLPLRAGTIWAGRVLAAALLVFGTMTAIVMPAALAAGELRLRREAVSGFLSLPLGGPLFSLAALVVLPPVFLMLIAHLMATALRSRSPWLLADLGGLTVTAVLIARALGRLVRACAPAELAIGSAIAAALALLVLLPSGGFGLARGGVLLARVHRAQAGLVAAGLVAAALAAMGFTKWALAVEAGDLTAVEQVEAAPGGSWLAVRGPLRHRPSYAPWMLVDTASGESLPLSSALPEGRGIGLPAPVVFSNDGSRAVWLRPQGAPLASPNEAVLVDLGARPRVGEPGVEIATAWNTAILATADRVAIAEPRRLAVWADEGRRLLAAAELPRTRVDWQQLRGLPGGAVRLARLSAMADDALQLQVWDFDVAARRLAARCDRRIDSVDSGTTAAFSADGARVLVVHGWGGSKGVELVDAATGASLATLAPAADKARVSAAFLPTGRVAVASFHDSALTLRLFDRAGAPLREMSLGKGRWAWLGSPWSTDLLPFTASVRDGKDWKGELRVVDLGSGSVRTLGARVAPLGGAGPWWPADDRVVPGALASHLFRSADNAIVRIAEDGRQTRVLPRPR
ncbi:MAG TPA: hypothetical protein VGS57_03725 [Thermoanaerobaculia bacterium]|jgi:hypothetical protein|nr:hypothetical protein [Thermoanaerobaculia bacterium]